MSKEQTDKCLSDLGADVSYDRNPLLHVVIKEGKEDKEYVELILNRGADIEALDKVRLFLFLNHFRSSSFFS